jgi:hypothetical protein
LTQSSEVRYTGERWERWIRSARREAFAVLLCFTSEGTGRHAPCRACFYRLGIHVLDGGAFPVACFTSCSSRRAAMDNTLQTSLHVPSHLES